MPIPDEFKNAMTAWGDAGGKIVRVSQPEGFCNTMSKYWIALRELGLSGEETITYFTDYQDNGLLDNQVEFGREFGFNKSVRKTLHKDQKKGATTHRIPGMAPTRIGTRTLGRGNLSSRDALLNLIIDNPGIYLYSISARLWAAEAGHAMAFDTRQFAENRVLYFMDPNLGQIWHDDADEDVETTFRTVFRSYWQWLYKRYAHTGGRDLYSYTANNQNTFSSMVMRPFKR
jgi:hypothetical protein